MGSTQAATQLWRMSAVELVAAVRRPTQVVQITGPRYCEDLCLDAAEAVEDACGLITPMDPWQHIPRRTADHGGREPTVRSS